MSIKIFDPREKPFGALSNNYNFPMYIEERVIKPGMPAKKRIQVKTVSNYIYSELLSVPIHSQIVQLAKPIDVEKELDRLLKLEENDETRNALMQGLPVKFANPELADALLSTGDSPIIYHSQNMFLGNGGDMEAGKGQNVYGILLQQLRYQMRSWRLKAKQEQQHKNKEMLIYEAYIAEKALRDQIFDGNDLREFLGMSPSGIIDRIGRAELMKSAPDQDTVLNLFRRGIVDPIVGESVQNPEIIASLVRKSELGKLRLRLLSKRKDIVFDMYADYVLEKEFPDVKKEQYEEAKALQFQNIPIQKRIDIRNRLWNLFEVGYLSGTLSDAVDVKIAELRIPTEDDVEAAEKFEVAAKDIAKPSGEVYKPVAGPPVVIYVSENDPRIDPKFVKFSPIAWSGMLNIGSYWFPTLTHFMLYKLILAVKGTHKPPAYRQMFIDPESKNNVPTQWQHFAHPDIITKRLHDIRVECTKRIKHISMKEALDAKFMRDRLMQNTLLMTQDAKLIWDDKHDAYLGVGKDKKSENLVGKYLMEIREKIVKQREGEQLHLLRIEHIEYIMTDPFMKAWIEMRVRDICRVVNVMRTYLWQKDEIESDRNEDLITNIMDIVYQPCSNVYGMAAEITMDPTERFRALVTGCPGFKDVTFSVVSVLWKRTIVMIYMLIKYIEQANISKISTALAQIEYITSQKAKCEIIIPNDELHNCIVSAILNVMEGLRRFNEKMEYPTDITVNDVNTAVSIILAKAIDGPIVPNIEIEQRDDLELVEEVIQPDENFDDELDEFDRLGGDIDYGSDDDEFGDNEDNTRGLRTDRKREAITEEVHERFSDVQDPSEVAGYVLGGLETILTSRMPKATKSNRINFFATQR